MWHLETWSSWWGVAKHPNPPWPPHPLPRPSPREWRCPCGRTRHWTLSALEEVGSLGLTGHEGWPLVTGPVSCNGHLITGLNWKRGQPAQGWVINKGHLIIGLNWEKDQPAMGQSINKGHLIIGLNCERERPAMGRVINKGCLIIGVHWCKGRTGTIWQITWQTVNWGQHRTSSLIIKHKTLSRLSSSGDNLK